MTLTNGLTVVPIIKELGVGVMASRKQHIVVVEWKNLFGESYDTEIPCASQAKAEKLIAQLSKQYHEDVFIQEFKVYYVCR